MSSTSSVQMGGPADGSASPRTPSTAVRGRGSGRAQGWLAIAVIGSLLFATAAAFVITERLKLTPSPIVGTHVSKTFSPVCRCVTGSASIRFRLRHAGLVEVDVIDTHGALVRRLARRRFAAEWLSFRWYGHDASGRRSADGEYKVSVHLTGERRTIVFPNTIVLDTVAPRIEEFRVTRRVIRVGERTRLSYRFRDRAHPLVLVDGREAIYGRFARDSGTLDWFGKVGGSSVRPGVHRLVLGARDEAGNTSTSANGIAVRVNAHPTRGSRGRRAKR